MEVCDNLQKIYFKYEKIEVMIILIECTEGL
jgi:hypothetical protein